MVRLEHSSGFGLRRSSRPLRRRTVLGATIGFAVVPGVSPAQPARLARVGWLAPGISEPGWTLFRSSMAKLGYIEGRTIEYEYRSAESNLGRLDELAAALVRLKVDVIVAYFTPSIFAAKKATSTIPIVFLGGAVDTGLVGNFAHPVGNLTGATGDVVVLSGKSVQLLHEIIPKARSVVALCNAPDPISVPFLREIERVARAEGLDVDAVMIEHPDGLRAAFDKMESRRPDGIVVQPSLPAKDVAKLALTSRLPAVSASRRFAEAGGLFSYAARQLELYRMLANYTDRILKGAKPSDLPVQAASRFELVVNSRTAKAIGLTLPPLFMARADEVIE